MIRRGMLLGSAGLATLALLPDISPAQTRAAATLAAPEYTAMTLMGGTLSRQTSTLAMQRATNLRVKQFASFEIAEQTAFAQVLTDSDNPPLVPLDAPHAAILSALQSQSGAAFDQAYIAGQLQQHQELMLVQQGYLASVSRNPNLQTIAILARASIQQHLTMLQDIQQSLG